MAYQADKRVTTGLGGLDTLAEVYDAEVIAAHRGFTAVLESLCTHVASNVLVCLDNSEAAKRLLGKSLTDSSQETILAFRRLASQWTQRKRPPHTSPGAVTVQWIPGHRGIPGNEEADRLAKEGVSQPSPVDLLPILANVQRKARAWHGDTFEKWREINSPKTYQDLFVKAPRGAPPEPKLSRRISCGRPKIVAHLFLCWKS